MSLDEVYIVKYAIFAPRIISPISGAWKFDIPKYFLQNVIVENSFLCIREYNLLSTVSGSTEKNELRVT